MEKPNVQMRDIRQFTIVLAAIISSIIIFIKLGFWFTLINILVWIIIVWVSFVMNFHPEWIGAFDKNG